SGRPACPSANTCVRGSEWLRRYQERARAASGLRLGWLREGMPHASGGCAYARCRPGEACVKRSASQARMLAGTYPREHDMLDMVIEQRRRSLGGFEVGRVLPFAKRRMVGPFIFFDHIGPVDFPPGIPNNVDVRPHPHIG